MPIEIGIWRLGERVQRVNISALDAEARLEKMLVSDISVISPQLMLIGRQVGTDYGKFIDLLAINPDGDLVVLELKRGRTPREVVAQLLDYASWVQTLSYQQITAIYAEQYPGKEFEQSFYDAFGTNPPEKLNQNHELMIVSSELDPSTERIIDYLTNNYGVPINAVFFRYFHDEGRDYLARTWLIDPQEAEAKASKAEGKKGREPWNGRDFYVSLGEGLHRTWNDCVKYGFVSGGQGKWYSQTLKLLFPGARIFVNIPKSGYVGVGLVKEVAVPVRQFTVKSNGHEMPILGLPIEAPKMDENADDLELCEYLVRVEWLKHLPKTQAYWEKGLFALQHTACKLTNRFTLERLTQHFGLDNDNAS